jgi:hypothetical protein
MQNAPNAIIDGAVLLNVFQEQSIVLATLFFSSRNLAACIKSNSLADFSIDFLFHESVFQFQV